MAAAVSRRAFGRHPGSGASWGHVWKDRSMSSTKGTIRIELRRAKDGRATFGLSLHDESGELVRRLFCRTDSSDWALAEGDVVGVDLPLLLEPDLLDQVLFAPTTCLSPPLRACADLDVTYL